MQVVICIEISFYMLINIDFMENISVYMYDIFLFKDKKNINLQKNNI